MIDFHTPIIGSVTALDLVVFAATIFIAFVIAKIVALYLKKSISDRVQKTELEKLIKAIQVIIILLAVFISLPSFDVNVADMFVIGGTAGIIIAFASQKIVSNFGSGLFLIIERPIKPGDNIRIEEVAGIVEEIRILSTIVKTYEGIYVRIPNEKVFTSDIINYVANVARRFEYNIGIAYHADAGRAMSIIRDLLEGHPYILKHPSPSVFMDNLGDSSVNITVYIWAPSLFWWSVKTEMLLKIKLALDNAGIEIPFPQRVITFARGTVPPMNEGNAGGSIKHDRY